MATDISTLTGWIALVLGEADKLRAAGVLSISVEGCSATFAAQTVAHGDIAAPDASVDDGHYPNPLYDPHTYPGGVMPGYQITRLDEDE